MLSTKFRLFIFLLLAFVSHKGYGQSVVSGFVTDSLFGEAVVGAIIKVVETEENTTTNNYGFYSLSLKSGNYTIVYIYPGYQHDTVLLPVYKSRITQNVSLQTYLIGKLVLSTPKPTENTYAITGATDINVRRMNKLPLLLGEVDVIKAVQLLPGVKGGTEGSSGFYVRGGSQDQNLVLLDGVPIYGQNHLFGFFSVFNNDAINSVQLYKGSFPARYGGRLSSVLDVTMKEGNHNKIKGTASLGAVIGRISFDGPLSKSGKTTFAIAARRTYIDWLAKSIFTLGNTDTLSITPRVNFYDVNLKLSHQFNKSNRLFFSIYQGKDDFGLVATEKEQLSNNRTLETKSDVGLSWKSTTAALRYNKIIDKHIFANYTASYTGYRLKNYTEVDLKLITDSMTEEASYRSNFKSTIGDINLKADFDQKPSLNHHIRYGASSILHLFNPGTQALKIDFGATQSDTSYGEEQKATTIENAVYIEDAMQINSGTKANIGIRLMHYGTSGKNFYFIEPRFAINEEIDSNWIFRMSYALNHQPVHMLANNNLGLPMDLWVPATKNIKPQKSHQVSLGVIGNLKNHFLVSADIYYRWLRNAIDIAPGANFVAAREDWQNHVRQGNGENYGLELLMQKQMGKATGWVSYTLSYANRQIQGINSGKVYPFRYDQRHNISSTWSYDINERNTLGTTVIFSTGYPITIPIGQYIDLNGDIVYEFGGKNNYRMQNYFRLDFNYVHYLKPGKIKWAEKAWYNISIFNSTNRQNPFYYQISSRSKTANGVKLEKVSLFPFFPSISFNVAF